MERFASLSFVLARAVGHPGVRGGRRFGRAALVGGVAVLLLSTVLAAVAGAASPPVARP